MNPLKLFAKKKSTKTPFTWKQFRPDSENWGGMYVTEAYQVSTASVLEWADAAIDAGVDGASDWDYDEAEANYVNRHATKKGGLGRFFQGDILGCMLYHNDNGYDLVLQRGDWRGEFDINTLILTLTARAPLDSAVCEIERFEDGRVVLPGSPEHIHGEKPCKEFVSYKDKIHVWNRPFPLRTSEIDIALGCTREGLHIHVGLQPLYRSPHSQAPYHSIDILK